MDAFNKRKWQTFFYNLSSTTNKIAPIRTTTWQRPRCSFDYWTCPWWSEKIDSKSLRSKKESESLDQAFKFSLTFWKRPLTGSKSEVKPLWKARDSLGVDEMIFVNSLQINHECGSAMACAIGGSWILRFQWIKFMIVNSKIPFWNSFF